MTNIYGSESHDHNQDHGRDDALAHEHGDAPEAPSDYEFTDEQGATVTEDVMEDGAVESGSAKGGRSLKLPLAVAASALLVLGGVAWWQFGSSSSGGDGAAPSGSPMAISAPSAAPPIAMNPSASVEAAPVSTVAPKTAAGQVAPASAGGVASAPIVASSPSPSSAVQALPAVSVAPAPSVSSGDPQKMDALTARVDALQKAIDQATKQLGQVSNMVAATAPAAGTAPVNKDLQDRLDRLEQQIAQLKQAAASPAPTAAARPALAPHVATSLPSVRHYSAPAPKKAVVSRKAKPVKNLDEETNDSNEWVLRAAMPGQAWVSVGAYTRELKPVRVGDELAGIGRVTAIQQQGQSWVVVGTKGSVR